MTPEDIRKAAQQGTLRMASSLTADALRPEIDRIYAAITSALTGRAGKGLWASDRSTIGEILSYAENDFTVLSYRALELAGEELGIELTPYTLWVDAALALWGKTTGTLS